MYSSHMTLQRHVLEQQRNHHVVSDLTILFALLSFGAKIMAREMRRAALVGELGLVGSSNITGDAQKKLDVFANETFLEALSQSGLVSGIVSEEENELKVIACGKEAKYIICMDPFDGSSNADINGAAGTIIGIYRKDHGGCDHLEEELVQRKAEQVAAVYIMYGPSTVFVYTCGDGVNGFTLDHDLGEFLISHKQMQIPAVGSYYSANLAHLGEWPVPIQNYIRNLMQPEHPDHKPYSLRYSGALVADVHRILLEGGIYLYLPDKSHAEGKLRYFYECAPMAMIMEQAGGVALTGKGRVLEAPLSSIHQRVPLIIGSSDEVQRLLAVSGI